MEVTVPSVLPDLFDRAFLEMKDEQTDDAGLLGAALNTKSV